MRAEPGVVAELKRIAGVDADELTLVHQGVKVRVTYRGNLGESRLELRADYDAHARSAGLGHGYRDAGRAIEAIRPMQIALRPEHSLDRHHKREGIDVEYQTGDPAFDEAVYVDTPTHASVLSSFLCDDVRAAAMKLFGLDFDAVIIDDAAGDVVAIIQGFEDTPDPPFRGTRALHAFVDLVSALPRVERASGRHPSEPLRTATLVCVAVSAIAVVSAAQGCDVDRAAACRGPAVAKGCELARPLALAVGAVVSVLFGAALHAVLAKRYSGRSSSSDRITGLCVAASFTALAVAAYAAHHVLLR